MTDKEQLWSKKPWFQFTSEMHDKFKRQARDGKSGETILAEIEEKGYRLNRIDRNVLKNM